jgi:uncharacterized membrane protein
MSISQLLIVYGITTVCFFVIDLTWLGVVGKELYKSYLGHLMRSPIQWNAAMVFYLIFIAGLMYFAIVPALREGDWTRALLNGALFGFFTYATYDLTNLATLKDWPLAITLIDMLWGTTLSALVAVASYFAVVTYIL